MDAIQKFIEEQRNSGRIYRVFEDGSKIVGEIDPYLTQALEMLEVMRESLSRIGMCVDPPDDYVWETTPTYEAQIASEALQKCEQIAEGE